MTEFLSPVLELSVILPGLALAYLPMKQYLKLPPRKLAALTVLFSILLCFAGGALCVLFSIRALYMLFPATAAAGIFYRLTLNVSRWKSACVFLGVCGIFSCLGSAANAVDTAFWHSESVLWLSPYGSLAWFGMCTAFLLAAWYPASHAARTLLEDEAFAQTWYVFWILPVLFIVLNLFILPVHPELLFDGRLLQIYVVVSLSLVALLSLFYTLFYFTATSLNRSSHLRQENEFLSMQQARYDSLKTAIEETREARHDMRHHFDALLRLASREEWSRLTEYLLNVRKRIPDTELYLCDNQAADSVAGHYALLFRKADIPFACELDLPACLPVPEIDLCLVLSNLLENALEASLKTAPERRQVHAQACLHSGSMILLTVENTFGGDIREKDGILQSSKRRGDGIGTQSVRHIAEKNGGYCRFLYGDGRFAANIMLRGKAEQFREQENDNCHMTRQKED